MNATRSDNRKLGLTAIELVVILACLFILVWLLMPSLAKSGPSRISACASNLRQIAIGEIVWAVDHSVGSATTNLPAQDAVVGELLGSSGIAAYYRTLSNVLATPKVFLCPSDRRNPAASFASIITNQLSYFLNQDAKSVIERFTVLNGDRHLAFSPPARGSTVMLTTNLAVRWALKVGHAGPTASIGNLVFADGSVEKTIDRELPALLAPSSASGHRLNFP
jgi:hypothetical protein